MKQKDFMEINFVKDEGLEYANLIKKKDGSLYRGQIRKKTLVRNGREVELSMMEGYGFRDFEDGAKYEGLFKDDLPHGKGVLNYTNGDSYSGEFKEGQRHGYGELYEKGKGMVYGEFENDEYVGKMESPRK